MNAEIKQRRKRLDIWTVREIQLCAARVDGRRCRNSATHAMTGTDHVVRPFCTSHANKAQRGIAVKLYPTESFTWVRAGERANTVRLIIPEVPAALATLFKERAQAHGTTLADYLYILTCTGDGQDETSVVENCARIEAGDPSRVSPEAY